MLIPQTIAPRNRVRYLLYEPYGYLHSDHVHVFTMAGMEPNQLIIFIIYILYEPDG